MGQWLRGEARRKGRWGRLHRWRQMDRLARLALVFLPVRLARSVLVSLAVLLARSARCCRLVRWGRSVLVSLAVLLARLHLSVLEFLEALSGLLRPEFLEVLVVQSGQKDLSVRKVPELLAALSGLEPLAVR